MGIMAAKGGGFIKHLISDRKDLAGAEEATSRMAPGTILAFSLYS